MSDRDSKETDLSALLEKAKSMTQTSVKIPLSFLASQSKALNQKTKASEAMINKGARLLLKKGFDVEEVSKTALAVQLKAFAPSELLADTDIDGFLRHEHNRLIITAIEEAKKETSKRFYDYYEKYLDDDWEIGKKELNDALERAARSSLTLGQFSTPMIGVHPPVETSFVGIKQVAAIAGRRGATSLDKKMQAYESVIYDFLCKQRTGAELINNFEQCSRQIALDKQEVYENWKLLAILLGNLPIEERRRNPKQFSEHVIANARKYLELQYMEHMNERYPNLKGKTLIERYVTETKGLTGTEAVWAKIYYALRSGAVGDALWFTDSSSPQIRNALKLLVNDNNYHGDFEAVKQEWETKKHNPEQHMKAVYYILAKLDYDGKQRPPQSIFSTTEDWVWAKLCSVQETGPNTIKQLQERLRNEQHKKSLSKNYESLLYFRVLLLCNMFEEAIYHLYFDLKYETEAVHFAIAMREVINISPTDADLLVKPPNSAKIEDKQFQINYHLMLRNYVQSFQLTDPGIAVEYYCLSNEKDQMIKFLKDLVRSAKDPLDITGGITKDGIIVARLNDIGCSKEKLVEVIRAAALEYDSSSQYKIAVELYFLAVRHCTNSDERNQFLLRIWEIMNSEISRSLTDNENRRDVDAFCKRIEGEFRDNPKFGITKDVLGNALTKQRFTFLSLVNFGYFFECLALRKFQEALEILRNTQLLEMDQNAQKEYILQADKTIIRRLPDILVAAQTCLYEEYKSAKSSKAPVDTILSRTKAIEQLAATIPQHMQLQQMNQLLTIKNRMMQ